MYIHRFVFIDGNKRINQKTIKLDTYRSGGGTGWKEFGRE